MPSNKASGGRQPADCRPISQRCADRLPDQQYLINHWYVNLVHGALRSFDLADLLACVPKEISRGDPRPWPLCGSSEVRLGRLGQNRFLAAIEPWHGNQVVVYVPEREQFQRVVIEDRMENGHALAVGDLDGDGRPDVVCIGASTGNVKLYENLGK